MTFKFNCPKCQKSIKATSELAGKVAKCPGCGSKLRIPTPQPAAAGAARVKSSSKATKPKPKPKPPADDGLLPFDDDEWDNALNPFQAPEAEDKPSKVYSDEDSDKLTTKSLRWTKRGLKMLYLGIVGSMLIVICFFAAGLARYGLGAEADVLFKAVGFALAFGYLACGIMLCLGPYFCLTVPEKTNARPAALRSAAAQTIAICLGIVSGTGAVVEPTEVLVVGVLTLVASLTSYFSFLSFMETLANHVRRSDIASTVSGVRTLGVVIGACYGLLIGIGAAGDALDDYKAFVGVAIAGITLTLLISLILGFLGYAKSLNRLSDAI